MSTSLEATSFRRSPLVVYWFSLSAVRQDSGSTLLCLPLTSRAGPVVRLMSMLRPLWTDMSAAGRLRWRLSFCVACGAAAGHEQELHAARDRADERQRRHICLCDAAGCKVRRQHQSIDVPAHADRPHLAFANRHNLAEEARPNPTATLRSASLRLGSQGLAQKGVQGTTRTAESDARDVVEDERRVRPLPLCKVLPALCSTLQLARVHCVPSSASTTIFCSC